MSILESHREAAVDYRFPRQTLISILVFCVAWEVLSPALALSRHPALRGAELCPHRAEPDEDHPIDISSRWRACSAALAVSFVLGVALAMAMYISGRAGPLSASDDPAPDGGAGGVLDPVRDPVVRGVEFRIVFVLVVVCGAGLRGRHARRMRGVPRELRDMMRSFRPTTFQFFKKLMLPAILPSIFTSWKITLSLAIRVVTIAELVGAVTGIGHQLSVAQELFSVADVFAWTLVLVALLFLLEGIISRWSTHAAVAHMKRDRRADLGRSCARCSARLRPVRTSWRSTGSISASSRTRSSPSSARPAAASRPSST